MATKTEDKPITNGGKAFVMMLVLLSVISFGGSFSLTYLLAPKPSMATADTTEPQAQVNDTDTMAMLDQSVILIPLEPLTTNLLQPSETWVRAELTLASTTQLDEKLQAELQMNLVAYFRSLSLDMFRSPSGFDHMIDDIERQMKVLTDGKVRSVYVSSLVFE